jgi:hypothetical protein
MDSKIGGTAVKNLFTIYKSFLFNSRQIEVRNVGNPVTRKVDVASLMNTSLGLPEISVQTSVLDGLTHVFRTNAGR